jgi:hypothetical protein
MDYPCRREFLKATAILSAGLAPVKSQSKPLSRPTKTQPSQLPTIGVGSHQISRLIIGGNPFSYIAHSEPLIYSNTLFKHYLTPDKIVKTLTLARRGGINTFLGRIDDHTIAFLDLYQQKTGEKMAWIGQTAKKPHRGASQQEIFSNIKFAADQGAIGCYVQGQSADYLVQENRISEIYTYLKVIRDYGMIAGIGAHEIQTIEACEQAGLSPDFYMKTFNRLEYACPDFEQTDKIMRQVSIPWIAFKVLAAGRLSPKEGFEQALDAGADFLCVGMFDFQVDENIELSTSLF